MHRLASEYPDVELSDMLVENEEADAIEKAVSAYLDSGYRTADIMSEGMTLVGCKRCGELVAENKRKE